MNEDLKDELKDDLKDKPEDDLKDELKDDLKDRPEDDLKDKPEDDLKDKRSCTPKVCRMQHGSVNTCLACAEDVDMSLKKTRHVNILRTHPARKTRERVLNWRESFWTDQKTPESDRLIRKK